MAGEQSQPWGGDGVTGLHWCCGGTSPGMPCPQGSSTDPSPGLGTAPPMDRGDGVASAHSQVMTSTAPQSHPVDASGSVCFPGS